MKNFMQISKNLDIPPFMEGFTFEKVKRIHNIYIEEMAKKSAGDNYNIRFNNLKLYVEEMLERGYTFQP